MLILAESLTMPFFWGLNRLDEQSAFQEEVVQGTIFESFEDISLWQPSFIFLHRSIFAISVSAWDNQLQVFMRGCTDRKAPSQPQFLYRKFSIKLVVFQAFLRQLLFPPSITDLYYNFITSINIHTFQSYSKNFSSILKDRYFQSEKQIKKQATIFVYSRFIMFINNSLGVPLQTIQNDLSQLQNQLLKLRLIMSQSPVHSSSSQIDLNTKFSTQIQAVKAAISAFCTRYEDQIRNLHSKLNLVFQISNGFAEKKQWKQDQKYFVINEKINLLERNLKKTQQNQNKLIETINILMAKYHINDQPTIIQNDEYLKSRIKTSQATSLITFQPCSGGTRRLSTEQISTQRDSLKKTVKKQTQSIYLIKDKSNVFVPVRNQQSTQLIRNLSRPGLGMKISLKQTSGAYNQAKSPNKAANQSLDLKDKRSNSLERHEHRFRFMMDNLYY